MAHQQIIEEFFPEKQLLNTTASIVVESSGSLRLKLPLSIWRELNIPDKGDFYGVVKGHRFKSRYDTTAGFRLRIPNMYHNLLFHEMNNGRRINIDLWIQEGKLHFEYKKDEESVYVPAGKSPVYKKLQGYCPNCQSSYPNEFDRCPECGKNLRKNPRKTKQEKPRIHIEEI